MYINPEGSETACYVTLNCFSTKKSMESGKLGLKWMLLLDMVSTFCLIHFIHASFIASFIIKSGRVNSTLPYCHCMAYPIRIWLSDSVLETRQNSDFIFAILFCVLAIFFLKVLHIFWISEKDFSIRFRCSRIKKDPYIQQIHLQIQ